MAINKKTDLPMSTINVYPNEGNLVDEYTKINELMYKTNRSNFGQISWESSTSGILYRTSSNVDNANVYNKGETGLYNLLLEIYGGDGGFVLTSDDYNKIAQEIESNSDTLESGVSGVKTNAQLYKLRDDKNINGIKEQNIQIQSTIQQMQNLTTMACTQQVSELVWGFPLIFYFELPQGADSNQVFVSNLELLLPGSEFWTSGDKTITLTATIDDGAREIVVLADNKAPIYNSTDLERGTKCRITYWYKRGGVNVGA